MSIDVGLISDLKELYRETASIWLGNCSPFDAPMVNILHSSSFRLSPVLHGKFKVVWFYEILLSDVGAWKIVLDEMIRLINVSGTLVIRLRQDERLNIIELKNFLGRSILLSNVAILHEKTNDDVISIAINITRKNFEIYQRKDWSFSMLTQGVKVENVISFCESIRKFDQNHEHDIIICGPKNDNYTKFGVRYLQKSYSKDFADISVKKNDIVDFALNENILIAHDRYRLDDNFFSGFERYGYDFDFLTIRQRYESGQEFPGYLKLKQSMKWGRVFYTDDESHFDDNFFLNGGLLIFKKKIISEIKFNHLLFWNQAEDVEISRQMLLNSIPPRKNYFSLAITMGISTDYTKTFKPLKNDILLQKKRRFLKRLIKIIKRNLSPSLKKRIKGIIWLFRK